MYQLKRELVLGYLFEETAAVRNAFPGTNTLWVKSYLSSLSLLSFSIVDRRSQSQNLQELQFLLTPGGRKGREIARKGHT